ncbi:hypothetical protein [Bosea minatitlanensis]|uniref:Uncharacterized protein n=1 Tax=Bosea minatitlanensis TaxID=128782 RepID=A0ABW0F2D4_9HYPH|nr:hypothetical protein [Bosea minatitlanensis]MCT4491681.1 hypothetical protein [Bosea minatitlanensis]
MTLICPSPEEMTGQALALLPRGRAWSTHEVGPRPGTVLFGFWRSVGEIFAFLTGRLCALHPEFFCDSHVETRDLWLAEYGLPDECDPFGDPCAKIRAQGGARCEDIAELAAAAGWSIRCIEDVCASLPGAGSAGCFMPGSATAGRLIVEVDLDASPAWTGTLQTQPQAGAILAGVPLSCGPDFSRLTCLLDRVLHAHLALEVRIYEPPRPIVTEAGEFLVTEHDEIFIA